MTESEIFAIEWQCEKLCRQFANYNDQNDFRAVCDLFAEDGSFWRPSVPDTEIRGRETIYEAFLQRPPLVIRHIVSNCLIDVLSGTEAAGHSYLIFLAVPLTEEPLPLVAGPLHVGEFRDRFVKTNDGWKFLERKGSLALKTG
jgi:hypothetical protein